MTVEQQSGRAVIILSLVVFVLVSLGIAIWDVVVSGAPVLVVHIPRLGLIIVLFIWMLRGSSPARWVLVGLLLIGGAIGAYTLWAGTPASTGAGFLGLFYLVLAVLLATSSSLTAYLQLQQARAATADR